MENPETLATLGTQDEDKQSKTKTQQRKLKKPVHGEVYPIQHYVIKFVSDLRQVDAFLRVLPFPPPIKLTATI
jgi:hypothetical protein